MEWTFTIVDSELFDNQASVINFVWARQTLPRRTSTETWIYNGINGAVMAKGCCMRRGRYFFEFSWLWICMFHLVQYKPIERFDCSDVVLRDSIDVLSGIQLTWCLFFETLRLVCNMYIYLAWNNYFARKYSVCIYSCDREKPLFQNLMLEKSQ